MDTRSFIYTFMYKNAHMLTYASTGQWIDTNWIILLRRKKEKKNIKTETRA